MPVVILRWNMNTMQDTISHAKANKNHRNRQRTNGNLKFAEEKEITKTKHFCKCHRDHV